VHRGRSGWDDRDRDRYIVLGAPGSVKHVHPAAISCKGEMPCAVAPATAVNAVQAAKPPTESVARTDRLMVPSLSPALSWEQVSIVTLVELRLYSESRIGSKRPVNKGAEDHRALPCSRD
jgi:hypothetical protein